MLFAYNKSSGSNLSQGESSGGYVVIFPLIFYRQLNLIAIERNNVVKISTHVAVNLIVLQLDQIEMWAQMTSM